MMIPKDGRKANPLVANLSIYANINPFSFFIDNDISTLSLIDAH